MRILNRNWPPGYGNVKMIKPEWFWFAPAYAGGGAIINPSGYFPVRRFWPTVTQFTLPGELLPPTLSKSNRILTGFSRRAFLKSGLSSLPSFVPKCFRRWRSNATKESDCADYAGGRLGRGRVQIISGDEKGRMIIYRFPQSVTWSTRFRRWRGSYPVFYHLWVSANLITARYSCAH